MNYTDIGAHVLNHYKNMLQQFKKAVAENGPLEPADLERPEYEARCRFSAIRRGKPNICQLRR